MLCQDCFDKGNCNLLKFHNNAETPNKVLLHIAGKIFILKEKKLRLYQLLLPYYLMLL